LKDEKCNECPFRYHKYVGSDGPTDAKIFIIGEAPGAKEEKDGKPFVGGAGSVLNSLLSRAGIDRSKDVYIANVLKCRPPNNKIDTPAAHKAIQCCTPKLTEELKRVKANVVVPMGNTALGALGYSDYRITHARGYIFPSDFGKVIPTFHPAYIMRQQHEFYTAWMDWLKIERHSKVRAIPSIMERFRVTPKILDIEMFVLQVFNRLELGEDITLAVDLETFEGNPMDIPIKTVGLAINNTHALVIPFITQSGNEYWQSHDEKIRAIMAIGKLLENPRITKMCHNALFDVLVLMNHGFTIEGPIFDTMLAQYLLYHPSAHSLEYLVSVYTEYPPWKLEKGSDDISFREYNARDCVVLHMMKHDLERDLKDNGAEYVFNILMNVIKPTCQMMLNGIPVDMTRVLAVKTRLESELQSLALGIHAHAGVEFNINSSKQLADVLFKKLKFVSGVKTKSGSLSTAEDVIKKVSLRYPQHPLPDMILEYKNKQKQLSTYIINLESNLHSDNRIRSSFKLHTAVTGRYTSSGPNLQNLPNRKDPGGYIRGMYRAAPGRIIIEGDYSQAELMIFAVLANDEPWLKAFANGEDVHAQNMVDMIGNYDPKHRTFIKNFVYGLIYGSEGGEIEKVAPKELMKSISVRGMLDNLQATHPAIFQYREKIERQITDHKYVTNAFGRKRWYTNKPTKADIRSAVNFPIQSTAADIMHLKTLKIAEVLEHMDLLILQLHDAYYIETFAGRRDIVAPRMKHVMEEPVHAPTGYEFNLKVEIEYGPSLSGKEMTKWQDQEQTKTTA